MTSPFVSELATPYEITEAHLQFFRQNGYIKLKQVLSPEVLAYYGAEITRLVKELNTMHLPMEERNTYQKAFLQVMNLWEHSEIVKEFVYSARLGRIAADLLEVDGVRMYHEQALYKEPSGGITPWHADQFYWPLESDRTVTVWIPLQHTPVEMGPLAFAARTHVVDLGRALPISDESEKQIANTIETSGYVLDEGPFDLGEVSFHLGWTFHRAGANTTDRERSVMTIIYMDKDIRVKQPTNSSQEHDWEMWIPGIAVGEVAASPKNLVLFER